MRLAALFLIVIWLSVLAQSSAPVRVNAAQPGDSFALVRSIRADASAGDTPTEEATASPEVPPAAQPTDVPNPTSTPSPVLVETILPTATLPPTEIATATATSDTIASPTTEPLASDTPPTDLPYATPDLPTQTITPLSLPTLATLDDGARDWLASPGWSLQPHENGLAWVISGASSGTLYWQTPISLRGVAAPVMLMFQSRFSGSGVAFVQASTDGQNWQPISTVPASESWTTVSVDLSRYAGGIIYIGFAWQGTDALSQWAVDSLLVAAVEPTDAEPSQVRTESVIEPSITSTPITIPTATKTEPATVEPSITAPLAENLTGTPFITPTEPVSATSTESAQVTATEQAASIAVACELDVDADGIVTDSDLAQIGREALDAATNETSIYDLDGNHQVDIGDLQMMAGYLFETCSD